ncbi:MAG TPA: primosomal protein N' [Oscillatoriales cyanobacterium M59_W2019_021]|nr:MAG: primosomal protein N' [Cyanobacteria bacterium J055]HIK30574.1 primosomal protein N' [Oscillatoriales cyanobacterium M4454_W2019_049]HIK50519.1 primosomal protein N' [Oscillatoriales cyanobacterium M59_W2019_021]
MSFTLAEPIAPYGTATSTDRFIEVLVDCPGADKLFTYRLPEDLDAQPGDILSVPFGAQQVGAIAIRLLDRPPAELEVDRLKEVDDIITQGFFPPHYWQLLEKVSNYYYTPLIQAIRVALPPGLLGRSQRRLRLNAAAIPPGAEAFVSTTARQILALLQASKTGNYTAQYLQQQVRGAKRGIRELTKRKWVESYLEPPKLAKPKRQQAVTLVIENPAFGDLTDRQREVLTVLQRRGGEMWLSEFLQVAATSRGTVQTLERKGCVVVEEREMLRTARGEAVDADAAKILTPEQETALQTLSQLSGYSRVLLHGVTGSGKTEVYLQAIAPILARGESALVLVPEIGLTPQLTDRFRARFGKQICVYHSALSDGERYDTWRQMLSGEPQVVIGTRSAVFVPLPKLGLILLDEEHDSSFKQDRPSPTYHARTVAQWRAELVDCPLVLGSATPSLESWLEIKAGGAEGAGGAGGAESDPLPITHYPLPTSNTYYLSLPNRIQSRPLPPIEVVDMRSELHAGHKSIFSRALQTQLRQLRETGQQGILFINRRGHSTFVSCRSCGEVMECPHCDVSLSYHYTQEGAAKLLRCHYCGHTRLQPPHCPDCGSPYLKFFGSGTQRVVQELGREFPNLRVLRFDSDTTRRKGSHRELLRQFAAGEADVLVGTQMLTKGLDLPSVSLVGIIAADGLLHLSDYAASERAFQTLTQVAGRAGRGDDPGKVILQTYSTHHPVVLAVQRHECESFIVSELIQRQALNYPPCGKLILLRLSGVNDGEVRESAARLVELLQPENEELYQVLGPVPAPILRIADRFRWQILIKFSPGVDLKLPMLWELKNHTPASVSVAIDVDPLNLG